MQQFVNDAMPIISVACILFFVFLIGVFTYRFSVSIDKSIIKSMGGFLYKIVCKSGFMVVLIVIATYFICKTENDKRHNISSGDSVIATSLAKEQ